MALLSFITAKNRFLNYAICPIGIRVFFISAEIFSQMEIKSKKSKFNRDSDSSTPKSLKRLVKVSQPNDRQKVSRLLVVENINGCPFSQLD